MVEETVKASKNTNIPDEENEKESKNTTVPDEENKDEEIKDAIVNVNISRDKLTASINIEPPENGGAVPTLEDIINALNESNVIYGLDMNGIRKLASNPIYDRDILIARGIPAVDEEDAFITHNIRVVKNLKPKINENGTVDFHDIGIVENISEGQVLCTKTPTKSGKEGKTVIGTVIYPKKGKDVPLPIGKNTKASEDNLTLIATSDGQADCVGHKINVLDTFVVEGDVGPKTGNIDFVGNIMVYGDVLSGYSVTANGNININGIVEAAEIVAEGNITIIKGVNGVGKGKLECGENINCKYMENCTAIAGGFIHSETILNSQIKCGENLELIGRRGMLIGGSCVVGQDVLAKTIGSDAYISTEIELGKDPELFEHHNELKEKTSKLKKEINDLNQVITYLQQLHSIGKITDEKKKLLDNAVNTRNIAVNDLQALNVDFYNIEQLITHRGKGKIVCTDKIYPGTKISIGMTKKFINSIFIDSVILKKDGEIIITSP
ncbi:MAG: FapA family protein [Clostridia bacterium]|nr:FapA family protein [Clostridia bacterium]